MSYTAIKIWNGTNSTWPRSPILKWWPGSGAFALLISCPKPEPCSDLQEFAFSNHRENPFSQIFWLCFYSKACTLQVSFNNHKYFSKIWVLEITHQILKNQKPYVNGLRRPKPEACSDLQNLSIGNYSLNHRPVES